MGGEHQGIEAFAALRGGHLDADGVAQHAQHRRRQTHVAQATGDGLDVVHRATLHGVPARAPLDLHAVLFSGYQGTRPLYNLTLAASFAVSGLHPFGYHVTSLLLHLSCGALVAALARRLGVGPRAAALAAALFLLHPLQAESVAYIVTARLGLETESHRYLAVFARHAGIPRKVSVELITKVAGHIEAMATRSVPARARKTKKKGGRGRQVDEV